MKTILRASLTVLAFLALICDSFSMASNQADDTKALAKKVDALANALRKGDTKTAQKQIDKLAQSVEDVHDIMQLYKPRHQRGFGFGPAAKRSAEDGIERRLQRLQRQRLGNSQLKQEAKALGQMAYRMRAMARVTEKFAPTVPPRFRRLFANSAKFVDQTSQEMINAVQKRDATQVNVAATRINTGCNNCHNLFRGAGARLLPLKKIGPAAQKKNKKQIPVAKISPAPNPAVTPPPAELQKEVTQRLAAIQREVTRLKKANKKEQADELASHLQRFRGELKGRIIPSAEPQVHVVGFYEGTYPPGGGHRGGFHPPGSATVDVYAADRPVILVLCSYEPIHWQIRLGNKTKLQKVILSGYYKQEVKNLPKGIPVEKYTHQGGGRDYFFAYKKDSQYYPHMAKRVQQLTKKPIATFQGMYRYRNQPIVIGPSNGTWRLQRLLASMRPVYRQASAYENALRRQAVQNVRFSAIFYTPGGQHWSQLKTVWAHFTPTGPVVPTMEDLSYSPKGLAVDPKGPTFYAVKNHVLVTIDRKTKQSFPLGVDPKLPRLSWPTGLTFDTKRRRLVLVSLGGIGHMYAYEPDTGTWSLLGDMKNIDLVSLTYAAEEDVLYGLQNSHGDGPLLIHKYSPKGGSLGTVRLSRKVTMSQNHFHNQIIAVGRKLVLMIPPTLTVHDPDQPLRSHSYLIDPKTGTVLDEFVLQPHAGKRNFAAKQLLTMWQSLKTADGLEADRIMWDLAAGHDQTVKLIRQQIKPLKKPDAKQVQALLRKLDSPQFRVREKANAELRKLGSQIEPNLRKAISGKTSLEVRIRIGKLLKEIEGKESRNPQLRQEIRGIQVLARIHSPAALEYLRELTKQSAGSYRARQAKESLRQLGQQ